MLGDFLAEAEKKAVARVVASEEKMRKEFAAMNKGFQSEVKKLTERVQRSEEGRAGSPNMAKLKVDLKEEIKAEVKSAVNVAGTSNINNQTGKVSNIDHKIGNGKAHRTFREREPGTLQLTGKETIDKKQAEVVIASTLSDLGISKEEYKFVGPERGHRFSVKFKEGAGQCTQPKEAAKLKADEEWKTIKFKREGDGTDMEYSFQYDVASNQQIKEIITKHIYKMIKDKPSGGDYKVYKKEVTLYNKFKCVVRIILGYREDSFQVKWMDAETFEETGIKTEDVEKELRTEFAKWCL